MVELLEAIGFPLAVEVADVQGAAGGEGIDHAAVAESSNEDGGATELSGIGQNPW